MVLVNVRSVIVMECTVSYTVVYYIVKRLGIHFSVLYRPNTCSYLIQIIMMLMFSPIKSQSRYKRGSYVSFSSNFSMCPFQTIFIFNTFY
jgi:hypothetical protein